MNPEMDKSIYTKITVIFFAVVLIFGFFKYKEFLFPAKIKNDAVTEQTQNKPASSTSPATTKKQATATTTETREILTYGQALAAYGSNRIQFDLNCQAIPAASNFKNGTKIMFDNRSNQEKWINLDDQKYYLDPYGFKIITVSSKTLPHTFRIDCGSGRNNGQITVQ